MKDSKNLLIKRPDPKAEFRYRDVVGFLKFITTKAIVRATVAQDIAAQLHH